MNSRWLDAEVTRISLADFPLPIYDADLERASGAPANAVNLKHMMSAHHGVLIASPGIQCLGAAAAEEHHRLGVAACRSAGDPRRRVSRRVFAIAAASAAARRRAVAGGAAADLDRLHALVIPEPVRCHSPPKAYDDMDN